MRYFSDSRIRGLGRASEKTAGKRPDQPVFLGPRPRARPRRAGALAVGVAGTTATATATGAASTGTGTAFFAPRGRAGALAFRSAFGSTNAKEDQAVEQSGNYVIITGNWANGAITTAGAVTWGNGSTGSSGTPIQIALATSRTRAAGSRVGKAIERLAMTVSRKQRGNRHAGFIPIWHKSVTLQ